MNFPDLRSFRETPPSSYILKIEKFSLLEKHQIKKYESLAFESGGIKWKLVLYPKGKEEEGGKDNISLYLAAADISSLPSNWEQKIELRLFAYTSRNHKYLMVQDRFLKVFNATKREVGIARFISKATFHEPKNGYLVDDCCIFGVEIAGDSPPAKSECFSMIEKPRNNKVTWKMTKFSKFTKYAKYNSHEFIVGGRKWRIEVQPRGSMTAQGEFLSVFLLSTGFANNTTKASTFVKFKLRVLSQNNGGHLEKEASLWYPADPVDYSFGFSDFMSIKDLHDGSKGFLVNDELYVGVEIDVVSITNYF